MQETRKIWMNGELVDWADATIHVGTHGLHYGSGVFEGIRAYETDQRPAVFRLTEHMQRLHDSAKLLYLELPYSVDELEDRDLGRRRRERAAVLLPAPDRLQRLRPARRGRARQPGRRRDHVVAVGLVPRRGGNARRHPRQGVELAAGRPERHPARREGDRRLHQLDARGRRGEPRRLRRGDPARPPTATSPTARARASSSSRTASSTRPTSPRRSSSGITRDTVIQIAQDLGHRVVEKPLIRTDLYLADEVFMVGTAAEVTPIREVDDHVIGRPAPSRVEIQQAYLDTVHGRSDRWSQWLEYAPAGQDRKREAGGEAGPAVGAVHRRARRGARARGAALRPALARSDDRPLRGGVRREGRRAVRGGRLVGNRRPAPALRLGRHRAGRRGDHLAVLVRRVGELLHLRGRRARLRRRRPAHAEPRPGGRRGGGHARTKAIVAVDIYGYPCELDPLRAIAEKHGLALIQDSCEALGAEYKGAPDRLARSRRGLRLLSEQADHDRRGRDGDDALGRGVAAAAVAAQPGPRRRGRLARARAPRLQLPPGRHQRRARPRPAREARRDPGAARGRREALRRAARRHRRRRDPVRRRRRPHAVVVRLRRQASRQRGARARDRALRARGDRLQPLSAVDPPAAVHARALRLRAKVSARCRRTPARARSRCRSSPRSSATRRSASPRRSRRPCECRPHRSRRSRRS